MYGKCGCYGNSRVLTSTQGILLYLESGAVLDDEVCRSSSPGGQLHVVNLGSILYVGGTSQNKEGKGRGYVKESIVSISDLTQRISSASAQQ